MGKKIVLIVVLLLLGCGGCGKEAPTPSYSREQSKELRECLYCGGTGNSLMVFYFCKGSGVSSGMRCSACNGRRFSKCAACNGTGKH